MAIENVEKAQILWKHHFWLVQSHENTTVPYRTIMKIIATFHAISATFQARMFAQVLQFTWPGCPLLYYGDELGLEGADDPHNRAPMPWGRDARRVSWLGKMALRPGKPWEDADEMPRKMEIWD